MPVSHVDSFVYAALAARVIFGAGTRKDIGTEMTRLRCRRAFILSGLRHTAAARELESALGNSAAGLFTGATMHTPIAVTEQALREVKEKNADVLIAIGGGSTIGLGKAIALRTDLPQIVVPTTYAGSEVTPILGETVGGKKTTIRDTKVLPEVVIYDVELTYRLPAALSATSGMNALAHAVEALYAKDRNPVTSMMGLEGIGALVRALPVIAVTADDKNARSDALYGAWLCGTVLGAVGMALHHKLCHVLGGSFGLPHAETHAVVLPHAVSFNAAAVPELLAPVAALLDAASPGQGLYDLAVRIDAPVALKKLGLPYEALDQAADIAMGQPYWNPRPLSRPAIRAILEDAWQGRRPQH